MENAPRPEGIRNTDIEQLRNTIQEHINIVHKALHDAVEEMKEVHDMLELSRFELRQFIEKKELLRTNKEMDIPMPSKEDIHKLITEITALESELKELHEDISFYTSHKAVFEAQLDELTDAEQMFKDSVTDIKPEGLQ